MELNKIHHIDVLEGLKKLEDDSIDCIVTSPPYWALRDYNIKDQIGLELNPQDFINKLVEVMKECKRVLKPTGTIWLNLGDSYYSYAKTGGRGELFKKYKKVQILRSNWLQAKQRLLIPYRITIKCQEELGLILRNDITWVKQWSNFKTKESAGSSMPTAVIDRLNTCSESLFFFVKSPKYYFNLDNIRVPYRTDKIQYKLIGQINYLGRYSEKKRVFKINSKGKNPGDCIMFPLEPSKERHFAMFPSTLPEFCIMAGCPQKICKKCGTPYLEIKVGGNPNSFNIRVRDTQKGRVKHLDRKASNKEIDNYDEKKYSSKEKTKVVLNCDCNAGFKAGIVLDPFMESGTTAIAAKKLGMNFIGFDLNKNYVNIANRRISQIGN